MPPDCAVRGQLLGGARASARCSRRPLLPHLTVCRSGCGARYCGGYLLAAARLRPRRGMTHAGLGTPFGTTRHGCGWHDGHATSQELRGDVGCVPGRPTLTGEVSCVSTLCPVRRPSLLGLVIAATLWTPARGLAQDAATTAPAAAAAPAPVDPVPDPAGIYGAKDSTGTPTTP